MTDFLLFQVSDDQVLTPSQCNRPFRVDGCNFYVGINAKNVQNFQQAGSTRNLNYQFFFTKLLDDLTGSASNHFTVVVGLEPPSTIQEDDEGAGAYPFVANHLDLVEAIAKDFSGFQEAARRSGKMLNIYIRYASEMNDKHFGLDDSGNRVEHVYEGLPVQFRDSFRTVRGVFATSAPQVKFSFSPALRADLVTDEPFPIKDYWPGPDVVDVIAGTWYVGREADFHKSASHLHFYLHQFAPFGKPFAIDELGGRGCDPGQGDPQIDQMLMRMLGELQQHNKEGQFSYVTVFLEKQWGSSGQPAFSPGLTEVNRAVAGLSANLLTAGT